MPILAGLVGALFAKMFDVFAARLASNIAFALAVGATCAIAIAVFKVAIMALAAAIIPLTPTPVVTAFTLLMPANLGNCVSVILIADTIRSSWDYWKLTASLSLGVRG